VGQTLVTSRVDAQLAPQIANESKAISMRTIIWFLDYNATPLGPPGTRVLVHDKPSNRNSWAPHGQDAWYIGPALDHYQCYNVWMWDTRREREPDTLTWFPQQFTMPTPSALDIIATS
jgi:hypothetical protein